MNRVWEQVDSYFLISTPLWPLLSIDSGDGDVQRRSEARDASFLLLAPGYQLPLCDQKRVIPNGVLE